MNVKIAQWLKLAPGNAPVKYWLHAKHAYP